MAMPVPFDARDWDVDQHHALPEDGSRYELIDGICSPVPRRVVRFSVRRANSCNVSFHLRRR